MNPQDALRLLAERLRCGDRSAPQHHREAVEAHLRPLIRCALRRGRGLPALVQWVRQNLPRLVPAGGPAPPPDPERAVPTLARLLCDALLERLQTPAHEARETVADPECGGFALR